jgi:phosphoribosyl-ATP pyrophosphohydrolase
MYEFLKKLETTIKNRQENPKTTSYVSSLFKGGLDRILKKIGEEAGEVIIAAKNQNQEELKNETADLLFHLLVTLAHQNLSLTDVVAVLEERHHGD